jgi:uncharacterized membrane protein YcaP (DUF421 family)
MTLFEFVIVFLIGGVVILSTVGDDRSVTNCVCAVITVGLLHGLVSWAKSKSSTLGVIIDGTPLVALKDDRFQHEIMKGMRLDENDLMAASRAKGLRTLDEVKYAVLERNGAISVLKKEK